MQPDAPSSAPAHGPLTDSPPTATALLAQPAWQATRTILRAQLAALVAAHLRFPGDDEALHDFRVALRRLRSAINAWRSTLAPGMERPGLLRRRLRTLAQETSLARDAEVQRALFSDEASRLSADDETAGARLVIHHQVEALGAEEKRYYAQLTADWAKISPLIERLRRRLRWARVDLDQTPSPFSRELGQKLVERVASAQSAMAETEVARPDTPLLMEKCHRLRIAAKHVRYTLDPIEDFPGVAPLLKSLKKLQDALGLLHDVAIAEARPTSAPSFAHPQSRHANDAAERLRAHFARRRRELFDELDEEWLSGGRMATLWSTINAFALSLVGRHE